MKYHYFFITKCLLMKGKKCKNSEGHRRTQPDHACNIGSTINRICLDLVLVFKSVTVACFLELSEERSYLAPFRNGSGVLRTGRIIYIILINNTALRRRALSLPACDNTPATTTTTTTTDTNTEESSPTSHLPTAISYSSGRPVRPNISPEINHNHGEHAQIGRLERLETGR